MVTADELDPYDLDMIVRVNGEERSRGNSSSIHWTFEDLIAHITKSETIHPGEFIASGTVGGGSGLEWQRYLAPGDTIELEVDGIGILKIKLLELNGRTLLSNKFLQEAQMVEKIRRAVTGHDQDGKSIFIIDANATAVKEMGLCQASH